VDALIESRGNITRAAEQLGIRRSALYRRLRHPEVQALLAELVHTARAALLSVAPLAAETLAAQLTAETVDPARGKLALEVLRLMLADGAISRRTTSADSIRDDQIYGD